MSYHVAAAKVEFHLVCLIASPDHLRCLRVENHDEPLLCNIYY